MASAPLLMLLVATVAPARVVAQPAVVCADTNVVAPSAESTAVQLDARLVAALLPAASKKCLARPLAAVWTSPAPLVDEPSPRTLDTARPGSPRGPPAPRAHV